MYTHLYINTYIHTYRMYICINIYIYIRGLPSLVEPGLQKVRFCSRRDYFIVHRLLSRFLGIWDTYFWTSNNVCHVSDVPIWIRIAREL